MSLLVLKPNGCEKAYDLAAEIFVRMYKNITGENISISCIDDGKSNIVAIGSDSVNDFVMNEIFEERLQTLGIRYGTDDYCIRSYKSEDRNILVLAGGRGRSSIYAVYDYFERFADCRYFWDGDIVPKRKSLPMENIEIIEIPRFEYRGLRYFAHRGLKRFQAEHWSFEDWQREIDWIMKKRLNFFMLRTGMDDVWQRAFPDIVPYPETYRNLNEQGYDDRSDFWTLKYKGELRQKIMSYANDNDITFPTDCGTMTHWYSRTPAEFLEKQKPKLLEQTSEGYNDSTGRVFDFREKENMNYYMKLTETMANEYDNNHYLFHTIGLGERKIEKDNKKNFMMKLFCCRRIAQSLREKFPDSKLLLASWDFVGWWRPEEVQSLIKELDSERTVILDYTSDGTDEKQNFTNWGVVNKFPWIYGLFHAYESESELRGQYDLADKRLKTAADDSYCKGMILWPELSHSDPIVLEYLAENSWAPLKISLEEIITNYCIGRYGELAGQMNECWQKFLPFMKRNGWGGYTEVENNEKEFKTDSKWFTHSDLWVKPISAITSGCNTDKATEEFFDKAICEVTKDIQMLSEIIEKLADINKNMNDVFVKRDSIDIIRTICGRFLNYIMAKIIFKKYDKEKLGLVKKIYLTLLADLSDMIRFNPDFSLFASFEALKQTAPVNPDFENTLKQNIINDYCRQCCNELIDFVFIPEAEAVFDVADGKFDMECAVKVRDDICSGFFETPLCDMQKNNVHTLSETMHSISVQIKQMSEIFY